MKFQTILGNLQIRKGHRRNCSQVEVVVLVEADDRADAARQVREASAPINWNQDRVQFFLTMTNDITATDMELAR